MLFQYVAVGLAFSLFDVSHGGLSGLDIELEVSNGVCEVDLCLHLGSEDDTCWTLDITSDEGFAYLQEECYAFEFLTCTADDLVFQIESDGDLDCDDWDECPTCPCTEEGSVEYYSRDIGGLYKQCYSCTCKDYDERDENTTLGWYCDEDYSIWWYEDEYDAFECPYNPTGSCTYGGEEHDYGEAFMVYSDSSTEECGTACYCDYEGTVTCETGATDIMANDDLYEKFYDECEWELLYCLDDPDSWIFEITSNEEYCSCPRCGCTTTANDVPSDIEFTEENLVFDLTYNGCASGCECQDTNRYTTGPDGTFDGYIDCDESYSTVSAIVCPPELTCTEYWSYTYTNYINGEEVESGVQFSEDIDTCNGATQSYCGNYYRTDFGFYEEMLYTGVEIEGGCTESMFCEIAQITDNNCVKYDVSFTATVTDCSAFTDDSFNSATDDWPTYTKDVTFTDYLQCCQGDYCNNQTANVEEQTLFDEDSCTVSTELGTLWSEVYTCQTSETVTDAIGHIIYCDSEDWYETMTVCEYLEVYINYLVGCYCEAMGSVYGDVSDAAQSSMQAFITDYLNEMNLFTDAYECDLSYTCDISDGVLSVSYTEYTVQFDLTLTNFNESTYNKGEVKSYIASIINVEKGSISLSNVDTASDSVSMTVTVTFETQTAASAFSGSLESDGFDFGEESTVSDVSEPETVVQSNIPVASSPAFGLIGFQTLSMVIVFVAVNIALF